MCLSLRINELPMNEEGFGYVQRELQFVFRGRLRWPW
jgi:hypothetical protein